MSTSIMAPAQAVTPYVGPQPFGKDEGAIFCGRQRETDDIFTLIVAHSDLLLYAQSGAGKTSLLNASIVPLLAAENFCLIGPGRVSAPRSAAQPKETSGGNVFVTNLLRSLDQRSTHAGEFSGVDLADCFGRFRDSHPELQEAQGVVLIIDQFEEVFTLYPDYWEQREGLFRQLGALVRDHKDILRLVISIREDYLASVTEYSRFFPERLKIGYRLKPLSRSAAILAVSEPPERLGLRFQFTKEAAERLVDELRKSRTAGSNEFVEPVQLQVVCERFWRVLNTGAGKPNGEPVLITEEDIRNRVNVDQSLSDFYRDCIETVAAEQNVRPGIIRRWITNTLITPGGSRASVWRDREMTACLPNTVIDRLVAMHLIRQEQRGTDYFLELTHDRLIEPIRKSNDDWQNRNPLAVRLRLKFEEQAGAWIRGDRSNKFLLSEVGLMEAEAWIVSCEESDLGYSSQLNEWIEASRRKVESDRRAYSRELAAVAVNAATFDPELSILLALQAEMRTHSDEGLEALHRAVLAARTRVILHMHAGPVWGVAFSPDGRRIATGSSDNRARIWDAVTGHLLFTLTGHEQPIYAVAFSPNGALLATASFDGTARIWHARDGSLHRVLAGHTDRVVGVAFRHDGAVVATGSFDHSVRLWDTRTGKEQSMLKGHKGPVIGVAFNGDGRMIATASLDKTVKLWDASVGRKLRTFEGHQGEVYAVSISPDETRIASSSLDQTTRIWDMSNGETLRILEGHTAILGVVKFDATGKRLATASADGTAKIWDAKTGSELLTLRGHKGMVYAVDFSPCGNFVATASSDGSARVWTVSGGLSLVGHTGEVKCVQYDSSGKWLASAGADGVRIWDADYGREVKQLVGHDKIVYSVAFSPDSKVIATGSLDATARIWDAASGQQTYCLKGHRSSVFAVAFSPVETVLATAGADGSAKIWDYSTGRLLRTIGGHTDLFVCDVAFSPDGRRIATGSADCTAKLWDVNSGELIRTFAGHASMLRHIEFSRDGRILGTASADGTAMLWEIDTGELIGTLSDHISSVNWIEFSQDGRLVATASSDQTVKVWDLKTLELSYTLPVHTGVVNSISLRNDGRRIASAGADKFVTLSLLDLEELKQTAQRMKVRDFTESERSRYLIQRASKQNA